jgi:hypothetical protein
VVFRYRNRSNNTDRIARLLDSKENYILKLLENEEEYFTNSRELSELLHNSGLNIRHLGSIYRKVTQGWLKRIIQAEIMARSLKSFYRADIQNCVLVQT